MLRLRVKPRSRFQHGGRHVRDDRMHIIPSDPGSPSEKCISLVAHFRRCRTNVLIILASDPAGGVLFHFTYLFLNNKGVSTTTDS